MNQGHPSTRGDSGWNVRSLELKILQDHTEERYFEVIQPTKTYYNQGISHYIPISNHPDSEHFTEKEQRRKSPEKDG